MSGHAFNATGISRHGSAARDLAERGYHVFPLRPRGKEPMGGQGFKNATRDERQILTWWDKWPDANIGVACGASGIVAFDIDSKAGADPREVLAEFDLAGGAMTRTGEAPEPDEAKPDSLAGVRGAHVIYSGTMATTDRLKVKGCEIRGAGAYVVVPPSVHPSGVEYTGELPHTSQLRPVPSWLPGLVEERTNAAAPAVAGIIESGGRDTALASLAGTMRRRGMSEAEMLAALRVANAERCRPPLADDDVSRIARSVGRYAPAAPDVQGDDAKVTDRDAAVQLATDAELWHSTDGTEFASIDVRGHRDHVPVGGRHFKAWLTLCFRETHGRTASPDTIAAACATAGSIALLNGPEHEVSVRVGHHGGRIYLDLCDPDRRVVEVDRGGWRIVTDPPVRFQRPANAVALPVPARGASLDALRAFVNAPGDSEWALMKAWLVGAMAPEGPYPLLMPFGEQGSGKSTTSRRLAGVLDPARTATRETPRSTHDLAIAARSCRVLAFDNLSWLKPEMSDALCRLSTGGGFATRRLYTDGEESTFYAKRPVIANGIEEVATRGDLLSRAIVVQLPVLEAVRDESTLEAEWTAAHPAILGGLLDATSAALREWDSTDLGDRAPRMADFARWVVASGAVPGFLDTYAGNRAESQGTEIDASPFASALVAFMAERGEWQGTSKDLLAELAKPYGDQGDHWPRTPKAMNDRLRRHAPALRGRGVSVAFRKANGVRTVTLRGVPQGAIMPSVSGTVGLATVPATVPDGGRPSLTVPENLARESQSRPDRDGRDGHAGGSLPWTKLGVEGEGPGQAEAPAQPSLPALNLGSRVVRAAGTLSPPPNEADPEWLAVIRAADTWWPGIDDGLPDAGLTIPGALSEFVPPGIGNVPASPEFAAALDRAWLECVLDEAEPPSGGWPARTGCTHPDMHRTSWQGDACSRCASEAVRLGHPVVPVRGGMAA